MRHHDWVRRLHAAVEFGRDLPYRPGLNDCAMFSAWCADRISIGTDYYWRAWALYSEQRVPKRMLETGEGLEGIATGIAGRLPIPMGQVIRGDTVLARLADRQLLSTSLGAMLAAAGPKGFVLLPCGLGVMGWGIR